MGFLGRVTAPARQAGTGLDPFNPLYYMPQGWWGIPSTAGVRVYPELALTLSALWCGVTFIAKNVGAFPLHVLENKRDGSKPQAFDHPVYPVLHRDPNQLQTAFEFYEMMAGHLLLRGNFYSEIVPGPRGAVDQLIPRHPDRVQVNRLPNGRLQYKLSGLGEIARTLTQDEMFHVRGFSSDGVVGMSVVAFGANSMGTALAADTYAGRFFKHGASAAVAVKTQTQLGPEGVANVRNSISSFLNGLENVGGVLVLEEGMSLDKIGLTPADAQLLTTREHSVREVARWLAIPAYLLSDGGKPATYASAYQFAQDLVTYTFRPFCGRIEARLRKDLILDPDRYFAEFDMRAMLRGDLQARAQFHHMAIIDGWKSRNEVRIEEGYDPEAGLDAYLEPLNMQDAAATPPTRPTPTEPPVDPNQDARHLRATAPDARLWGFAEASAQRIVRKERAALERAAVRFAKDGDGWATWLREFYTEHAAYVAQALLIPTETAREYCAQQGLELERRGLVAVSEATDWEWTRVQPLACWGYHGASANGNGQAA